MFLINVLGYICYCTCCASAEVVCNWAVAGTLLVELPTAPPGILGIQGQHDVRTFQ